jgi:hypothetical protein
LLEEEAFDIDADADENCAELGEQAGEPIHSFPDPPQVEDGIPQRKLQDLKQLQTAEQSTAA